jgi:hypothetical protein
MIHGYNSHLLSPVRAYDRCRNSGYPALWPNPGQQEIKRAFFSTDAKTSKYGTVN